MANNNPLNAVAKRFGITVREARDIATAVSTATSKSGKFLGRGTAIKDIKTQVKETARAAATGKKGTTAYTGKPGPMTKGSKAKGVGSPDYRVTKTKRK
jgi:hypothetical protein